MFRMRSLLAILALSISLPLLAQERFGERVDVNVVLLDVIVTDSKGNHILGLGKDDFRVKENGVEQTIESVDYFTNRQLLNAREENAPFKVERVREERYFIFFFDKPEGNQLFDRLSRARQGVREFIDNKMRPGDQVAIAGHDVRLKIYSDFTSDKTKLRRAVDEVASFSKGMKKSEAKDGPSLLATISSKEMMDRTGTVYEALRVLAEASKTIRARKNLILFSPGIHEPGEEVRDGVILNESRYYQPTVRALNGANVAVYAMNLLADGPELPVIHQTLQRIAADTSGEYFRHVIAFDKRIEDIEQTNSGYYLLTYTSRKPKGTAGYQKVDVSVSAPELRIKARDGYAYGE